MPRRRGLRASDGQGCLFLLHRQRHSDSYSRDVLLCGTLALHLFERPLLRAFLLSRGQSSEHHDRQHQGSECGHDYRHADHSYCCRFRDFVCHNEYRPVNTLRDAHEF